MQALVCNNYGPPEQLVVKQVEIPEPQNDEIQIEVYACGCNFPDVLVIQNKYQTKQEVPFIPGSEVSGIVTKIGKEVSKFKVGDRVYAMILKDGFAQKICVGEQQAEFLSPAMDFTIGACFSMTYGTSFHALKDRARLKPKELILILGASGGVGLACVELAKAMGAIVIAAASSDQKLQICKQHGADYLINYSKGYFRKQIAIASNQEGPDVIYDPIGGELAEQALRSIKSGGRYLVVGFAAGTIPKIPLNLYLLKQVDVLGVFWGAWISQNPELHQKNVQQILEMFEKKLIKMTVYHQYSLQNGPQALRLLMDRKAVGKVAICPKNQQTPKL